MADKLTEKWMKWNSERDPKKKEKLLNELFEDIEPVVDKHIRSIGYSTNAQLTPEVIKSTAVPLVLKGIASYDPKKEASLTTHIHWKLRRMPRELRDLQNIGHIPENRALRISKYKEVLNELREKLEREPSVVELSEELNWPQKEVVRMQKELVEAMPISTMVRKSTDDMGGTSMLRLDNIDVSEISEMFYHTLTGPEQYVFEHSTGFNGAPIYSAEKMAKDLKKNVSEIYRIKRKLANELAKQTYGQPKAFLENANDLPVLPEIQQFGKIKDFF